MQENHLYQNQTIYTLNAEDSCSCKRCGRTELEEYEAHGRSLQHCRSYNSSDQTPTLLCKNCHQIIHTDEDTAERFKSVLASVTQLLTALGADLKDGNYRETPRRVTSYLLEHFLSDSQMDLALEELAMATFESTAKGVVAVKDITANGMCPHHLLPVIYRINIAYLPAGKCIGLSKLPRIARVCAQRPMLQEDLTQFIADALIKVLNSEDVAVVIIGKHQCMSVRGIEQHEAATTTSVMRGVFLKEPNAQPAARDELFQLIKL